MVVMICHDLSWFVGCWSSQFSGLSGNIKLLQTKFLLDCKQRAAAEFSALPTTARNTKFTAGEKNQTKNRCVHQGPAPAC